MFDDEVSFEEEVDVSELEISETFENRRKTARRCVETFFEEKELFCGGEIPNNMLLAPDRISMVASTDVCTAIETAYAALEDQAEIDEKTEFVTDDIRLVLNVFTECKNKKIPKEYAGGILLLYLEFCIGIDIV